ncbi:MULTISPECIES: 3-oxoacyl-ACP synthase III family protein [Streptomyces]|uniref:3-oxoacyl-[acyl-carrier-protein] synthase III C-terminal domain-containing protein n=1 Tax=Streptomyces griseiscabiei TaxID=2993540 RepID=A0ABU4L1T7_9ACTN|nr:MULTISPECIES: 3-oxoacyl-[acyl-carrier-protein] synthase III C-terminal domain-containing protein [Streptomyces]MBZ3906068.1 3-oxoacyl-ACP synthase [Streptomyces griseiscabiei]MDX2909702.1 3-oxoacyl-[acyl-carrier-protein] synthase III C-terminal domain-containing protein [Streptomyces griseiscabiei]
MAEHSAGILATGSYVPKDEIDNAEVARRAGATAESIGRETRTRTRRYAAPDEAASDLAARAAERALARAGVPADRIDYLVVSTATGDFPQPPTAHLVQNAIDAHRATCFDIGASGSGFLYGLDLVRGLLRLHGDGLALVICTEVFSRFIDFADHRTAALLGDGAAAALVGPVPSGHGLLRTVLSGPGDAPGALRIRAGGSRVPPSHASVAAGGHHVTADRRATPDSARAHGPAALAGLVRDAGYGPERIDHLMAHRSAGPPPWELARASGLRNARAHCTVEEYGDIGSASLPLTLDLVDRAGLLRDGDLVLLAGLDGGTAIGASLMRWSVPGRTTSDGRDGRRHP